MTKTPEDLPNLVESLADYAHRAWSGWMRYMFELGTRNDDGTITIPRDLVERWDRQRTTEYADLSEAEKDSDRKEALAMIYVAAPHVVDYRNQADPPAEDAARRILTYAADAVLECLRVVEECYTDTGHVRLAHGMSGQRIRLEKTAAMLCEIGKAP